MISKFAMVMLLCTMPTLGWAQTTQIVTKTGPTGAVTETDTTTTAGPASTQAAVTLGTSIVPGSGITPATTLSSGGGTEESALLENVAVREAAAQLVALPVLKSQGQVLIVDASTQTPDASAWISFTNQVDTLKLSLEDDYSDLNDLDRALKATATKLRIARGPKFIAPILAVGLPVAQKVLSYFNTTYSAGGVALGADDYLVEIAVLHEKPDWQILGQNVGVNTPMATAELQILRDEITKVKGELSTAKKDLDPNDQDGAAKLTLSQTAINADIKAVTDYISAALAPASMSAILQSQLYTVALNDPKRGVLYLRMHSASGGVLTRTTFWSNLGIGMPISNGIAVKISYVFYAAGQLKDSGEFDVATHNLPADKVLEFVDAYDKGQCKADTIKSDLKKACPITVGLAP